jgi:hypothetical protein
MKRKRPRQGEFRFGEHARLWASMSAGVHRHVIEILGELLRTELHRRREVRQSDQ